VTQVQLTDQTAHELLNQVKAKKLAISQIYDAFTQAIQQQDSEVQAFVRKETITDCSLSKPGENGIPLPIAIKDNMCIKGMETTCCSHILKGFKPPYDATVVSKLRESGLLPLGQTNMDEFAFGSSTENSCYGPTRNPWHHDYVPGGSSGGSGAAVGGRGTILGGGSWTWGSIQQPASFCGVVGLKPTYGRVSRYGLIAFASSLDQIGPLTRDITDSALLLNIIAGYDEMDSTSVQKAVPDYSKSLLADVKGLKIGVPKEYFIAGIDPEVKQAVREAIDVLKQKGAAIVDVSLPHTDYCVATYYIVATAEASSNLARYDGVRYGLRKQPEQTRKNAIVDMFEETREAGFGQEVKRRIMLGTYSLSSGYYDAYYLKGQKVRTLIKNDFDQVFSECDAIIAPTSPTTAFKIGERANDPLSMYLSDVFTISANLSGIPAVSLPCGFSKAGLPIGLQIMAKPFDEEMLFRVGYTFEQATDWHKRKPAIT